MEERINYLMSILTGDEEYAKELFEMSKEEALEKLTKDGYNVTIEDLDNFNEALTEYVKQIGTEGELDEASLEKVAGGYKGEPGWYTLGKVALGGEIAIASVCVAGGLLLGW